MLGLMVDRNLTERLAAAARSMRSEHDVQGTLQRAVELAPEVIKGCDQAGVSMVRARKRVDTPAATDDVVRRCDQIQYELNEGPCLDAIWHTETVSSADLGNDDRWPIWGRRVSELGMRSALCFQLFTDQDNLGALNLYSTDLDGFGDDDYENGLALAAHVAVALAAAQEVESLNSAVASRTVIGQAEGILMERYDLQAEEAFAVLRRVSQDSNVKVAEIASDLVRTRQTPGT